MDLKQILEECDDDKDLLVSDDRDELGEPIVGCVVHKFHRDSLNDEVTITLLY